MSTPDAKEHWEEHYVERDRVWSLWGQVVGRTPQAEHDSDEVAPQVPGTRPGTMSLRLKVSGCSSWV
jgi:hypothetical protein